MLIALLALLGVDLIVLVALLVVVIARKRSRCARVDEGSVVLP